MRLMNEARLSHLPFWGPSEAFFFLIINVRRVKPNKTFAEVNPGVYPNPSPKLERFIQVNPTAVEFTRKKPSLGPQNSRWLKRASFIKCNNVITG